MPRNIDPPRQQRRAIASLAHATAHEVCALRDAKGRVHDGMDAAEVRSLLDSMIDGRQVRVSLMADKVVGHA